MPAATLTDRALALAGCFHTLPAMPDAGPLWLIMARTARVGHDLGPVALAALVHSLALCATMATTGCSSDDVDALFVQYADRDLCTDPDHVGDALALLEHWLVHTALPGGECDDHPGRALDLMVLP
jgi:hypothetical protein